MFDWIGQVLGAGIVRPIATYFTRKQELEAVDRQQKQEFKQAVHQARLENIKQGKINEAQWNIESIRNSSWKDEWFTIILSIPLVLCFFPSAVDYVLAGFDALSKTPPWYRGAVMVAISSAFGFQKYFHFKNKNKFE